MACIFIALVVIYFSNVNLFSCENSTEFPTATYPDQMITASLVELPDWTIQDIIDRIDEYYLRLCGDCQQMPDPSASSGPQCFECNCDDQCELYGDCCEQEKNNESLVEFQCISYDTFRYLPSPMFMKVQCADNFRNETIKRACDKPPDCLSTPVTSDQGITYINEYCAQCNSETNYTKWNLMWDIFPSVKLFQTISDVYACYMNIQLDVRSSEVLLQSHPRECPIPFVMTVKICNTTGRWHQYNSDLKNLCQSSKRTDYRPLKKFGFIFKNIFCYFCNGYWFSEYISHDPGIPGDIVDIVNFQLKLKSNQPDPPVELVSNNTFFDPFQNRTLEILCNKGFNLTNGTCIADDILHQVFIGLRLNTGNRNISHKDKQILENVKFKLQNFRNYVAVINQHEESVIDVKVFFVLKIEDLEVSQKAKDKLYFDWLINYDVISPDKVYIWNEADREPNIETVYHISDDITSRCLQDQDQPTELSESFIHYTNQYNCSYVEYDLHDFQNSSDHSKQLGNLSISHDEYTISGQKIKICVETIKEKYEAIMNKDLNTNTNMKAYWIWFRVCLAISLGCLLFTLLTYSMFPSLRSLPVKNNMILIIFLMVGQLLLFTESHIDLKDLPCVCYGIVIHYAWLCVTFWMNTGSYHMFRVFRSLNVASSSSSTHWKILLKYALYANGVPIIIIVSVVIGSYFTSGTFGYGKNVCYLDSRLLIIVAMVSPMTITIAFNLGFLFFTIWSISKTAQMAKEVGKDRHHIWVYIKLSTLTGLFWAVSILNNFIASSVLSYIAVFLNYGQGFFIFLSYMVNKRILKLWLGLCGKQLPDSTLSTSSNQTVKTKL